MVVGLIQALLNALGIGQVILTLNIPENLALPQHPRLTVVTNADPKGFGANHNAAFRLCRQPYFCVLNPDITLQEDPFPALIAAVGESGGAIAAPRIVSPSGATEDSARRFPTAWSLARKAFGGHDGRYEIDSAGVPMEVDWVAGMFMLFSSADYARLGGFDERYFLYYEDVDICARAWRAGMKVRLVPSVAATHDARRASHRNIRHMRWHLASMARYLLASS